MFTKIFNSNSIFSIVIFIVMTLVLWAKVFTNTIPMIAPIPASPLYHLVFKLFNGLPVVCAFISIAMLVLQALLINHILVQNDLIPRKSYIAAFLFVISLSFFNATIVLNPALIAGLFIVSALWLIFRLYEEEEAYQHVFNIGTLISIASMFYLPAVIFMLLVWAGFIIYRIYKWREWFISILGFLWPYLFLATYYYWNDCLISKIVVYKTALGFINLYDFSPTNYVYMVIAFLGLLTLASVFKLLGVINEKQIRIRKFISFLIWFLIISFVALSISAGFGINGFLIILVPFSVLFSLYLSFLKRSLIGDIALLLLLMLIITGRLGVW